MLAIVLSNLELRADSVRTRHDDGILESRGLDVKQSSKPANDRIRSNTFRSLDDRLDSVDELVSGVDRHTRRCISETSGLVLLRLEESTASSQREMRELMEEETAETASANRNSPVCNVLAERHAIKVHRLDTLVSKSLSLLERGSGRSDC